MLQPTDFDKYKNSSHIVLSFSSILSIIGHPSSLAVQRLTSKDNSLRKVSNSVKHSSTSFNLFVVNWRISVRVKKGQALFIVLLVAICKINPMVRKPRLHILGSFYHVTLRGNGGQDVFFDRVDC